MQAVEPVALSVSQLTRQIKNAIETRPELRSVFVRGEVSNLTRHSSGHLYFSLKDENSQIRAVMFNNHARTLPAPLRDGLEITAIGSISLYEKRGEYQLYVTAARPAGLGALFLQFEKLKKKLADEGLFDESRKRPIPEMPARIAVVTSPTGAAVRDVIKTITKRFPAVEITVVPALVQGADAPESVRRALARARQLERVETILLVRGGGSLEDLWAFNDEALARDIAACDIPIISGVGHETDFTIADFVSDFRAPTPTGAAQRAVPDFETLKQQNAAFANTLRRSLLGKLNVEKSRLRACASELAPRRLYDIINQRRQAIDDIVRTSQIHIRHRIAASAQKMQSMLERFNALDPYAVLRRGYSVLRDANTGKLVTSVAHTAPGKELDATLSDGTIRTVVIHMQPPKKQPEKKRETKIDENELDLSS